MSILDSVLYPCVRVRAGNAGGSGTVVASRELANGEHATYVLTCHHVIDAAIEVKDEWDPALGKERKIEYRHRVGVEFFRYKYGSRAIGVHSAEADVVAWSKKFDLAILQLRTIEKAPNVAVWYPKSEVQNIQLLDRVFAIGCALLHPPILTEGRITSLSDEVESVSYWMSDAQIIFGNSGGGIFHQGPEGELRFIGVPSLVSIVGWSTPVTHMGYFSDIERIYRWLEEQCYQFLYDPAKTIEECDAQREEKRREELDIYKRQQPSVDRAEPRQHAIAPV